ncbi:hypothetical protein [Rhizobium oryziradicis]|uniref:Uncharacterized protein n=1 Tax=Rhizobium oryziradicis TaxID=1867956 RepID=A0A1Q8ZYA8_9HYPH|nr:hypothetical protein [Rhizobium oryziradicis]OLP47024.1 hypothetical protein BJF95_14500 [Rhizobium oryziradicis]
MLFNIEFDHGDALEGYLVPDGFSDQPSIIVRRDDGSELMLACDQERPAVVQSGRHATGLVGFRLDAQIMPDLALQTRLLISDAKSGLLIYRRPSADNPLNLKLLQLQLTLLPMVKFDMFCSEFFQFSVSTVERFGHETTLQAFHLNNTPSIYISGRVLFRNYEEFLDKGFKVVANIPDPYYEMATRLFMIKRLSKHTFSFLGERDRILLSPAVEYFADINLGDKKEIARALKKAHDRVANIFRSPITRQLVCTHPEQTVTRREVAPAIDALSRFAVIGYGYNNNHFQDEVGAMLGVPGHEVPIFPQQSVLSELATILRDIPIAEMWLEEDIILDYYVRQAVAPYIALDG